MRSHFVASALTALGLALPQAWAQEGMPVLKQVIPHAGWPCTNKIIAIKGEWMAISCLGGFDPAQGQSRIEMWRLVNGTWSLRQALTGPIWEPAASYGLCASNIRFDSTGTKFVAGDPRFNGMGPPPEPCEGDGDDYFEMHCGERVRVFVLKGDEWTLDLGGDLAASPAFRTVERRFGYSADVEGSNVLVGGPWWTWNNPDVGPIGSWGAWEGFVRLDSGWTFSSGSGFPSNPGCVHGLSLIAHHVWISKPPLPKRWHALYFTRCNASQHMAHGEFDPLGNPIYQSTSSWNWPGGVGGVVQVRQDESRFLINSYNGEQIDVWRDYSIIQNLPNPGAPGWGRTFDADAGRLAVVTQDNRLFMYDWDDTANPPAGYVLRSSQIGPQGNPFAPPTIGFDPGNPVNPQFVSLSGNTLAILALSGDILLYELFTDCNGNNQSDLAEIAANPLVDCDSTGVLDECEPLPSPPPVPVRSTWKAPLGGSFQDAANWCRLPPVNTTAIEFGTPFTYGVTLSQTREVRNVTVSNGFPTLSFNSPSLTLRSSTAPSVPSPERFLRVGTSSGVAASLGVLGGTVNTAYGEVGVGLGTEGTLLVGPGGKVISTTELCVGCEGEGTLLLQNGGQAVSQKAIIGKGPSSAGLATVESADPSSTSRWSSTLGIDVKNGTLAVNGGGVIDSPALGVILYAGGSLTGNGTIIGPLTNFGAAAGFCGEEGALGAPAPHRYGGLVPGGASAYGSQSGDGYGSIGTLTVNGLYQQIAANPDLGTNSGSLLVEVGKRGTEVLHDRIVVNGPATLGGGLFVTLATEEELEFEGLPILTATSIDPDRPNFDVAFMPALPGGRFVKVDAPTSLQGGGGAITISTSDLGSVLGFGGASSSTFDLEPLAAAVGDFDGANGNDVAVTLKGSGESGASANGSLLLLFNDGEGGLANVVQLPNQLGRDPVGIVSAPLRPGRKVPDLAVVNRGSETLQVLYNDGIGNFTTGQTVSTGAGSAPSAIDAVPIFAEDPTLAGIHDLVIANFGQGSLSVYFNPGDGAPIPLIVLPAGVGPTAVRGVDIDNNRFFDLVAANKQSGTVSIFMRQAADPKDPGSGGFTDALNLMVGEDPVGLAAGDLDGDGRTDVTTVNRLSGSISVLLNRSTTSGEASFAPAVTLPTGGEPQSLVLGDFDQDTVAGDPADLDLALTARATSEPDAPRVIKVIRNDRANGVLVLAPADDLTVPGSPRLIVADEFDPAPGEDIVSLSLGGAETFQGGAPVATASLVPSGGKPKCAAADLDCDGTVDALDLAILLAAWGTPDATADVDGSGTVDALDLAVLLAAWGSTAK